MAKERVRQKITMSNHPLIIEEGHDGKTVLIHRSLDYNWEVMLTADEAELMAKALTAAAENIRKKMKTKAAKLLKQAK